MDRRAVVFTKNNARILAPIDETKARELAEWKNAILDPDLSKVEGVPPHFWKVNKQNEIVPMNDAEKAKRLEDIERLGVDNAIQVQKKMPRARRQYIKPVWVDYLAYLLICTMLALIMVKLRVF